MSAKLRDPVNFLGKTELVNWLNSKFPEEDRQITKIEDCKDGIIACKLMTLIFPNSIPLKSLKFPFSYVNAAANFQLLKVAFQRKGVKKEVDPNKLSQGKFSDLYDLLLFMKNLYDTKQEEQNKAASNSVVVPINDNMNNNTYDNYNGEYDGEEGEENYDIYDDEAKINNEANPNSIDDTVQQYNHQMNNGDGYNETYNSEYNDSYDNNEYYGDYNSNYPNNNSNYNYDNNYYDNNTRSSVKRTTQIYKTSNPELNDEKGSKKKSQRHTIRQKKVIQQNVVKKKNLSDDENTFDYVKRVKITNTLRQHNYVDGNERYNNIGKEESDNYSKIGLKSLGDLVAENNELKNEIDQMKQIIESDQEHMKDYDILKYKIQLISKALPKNANISHDQYNKIYNIINDDNINLPPDISQNNNQNIDDNQNNQNNNANYDIDSTGDGYVLPAVMKTKNIPQSQQPEELESV